MNDRHEHIPPRFVPASSSSSLVDQARELLREQKVSWQQLREGYAALEKIKTRDLACDGFTVRLQFNPGRIVSTAANVDAESIKARRCFLCVEHLPEDQQGILVLNDFLILCNPAPIFREHFTISHVRHIPQVLESSLSTFLELARILGPDFVLFYNGPKCGASAPDHLHFQASPAGAIPVEEDAVDADRRERMKSVDSVRVARMKRYGRSVIVLEGKDPSAVEGSLRSILAELRRISGSEEEPLLNLLCFFANDEWKLILFPRSKHRPDAYFRTDDRRIVVSPAAVDMGGLLITPREEDFRSLDPATVTGIYREVSVDEAMIRSLELVP